MTSHAAYTPAPARPSTGTVLCIGAGFAAAMGLGRFVYTPLLPVMTAGAGLSEHAGAQIATSNYLGYLLGAALTMVAPRSGDSRALLRICLAGIVASEAAMALVPASGGTVPVVLWWLIRLVAGICSGVVFVHCSRSVGADARSGWAFAGVGAGILLSGLLAAVCSMLGWDWAAQWWVAAAATAVVAAFSLHSTVTRRGQREASAASPSDIAAPRARRLPHAALVVSYLGEGAGYIIIGTFIVAAVAASAGAGADDAGGVLPPGTLVWMVAGAAVVVSIPCWAALRARWSTHVLLVAALALQIFAAVVPAVWPGVVGGMVAAVLFGGTFVAIVQLTLARGVELGIRNSAAVLVTVYSVGQILGPLAVGPAVAHGVPGYRLAFAAAGAILLVSTVAALLSRTPAAPDRGTAGR